MKLLLTVVALVAVAHGAPTTHIMEIGSHGVSGSILNVPLVDIIVNMMKDTIPGTVTTPVEAKPVIVGEALNPEPVNVVEIAQNLEPVNVVDDASKPVIVVELPAPELPGNPIDVISVNSVPQPTPEAVVLPAPTPAEVIEVPAPIVLPEPTPAEVVAVPEPVVVVPGPAPEIVAVPEPVVVVPGLTPETIAVPEPVVVSPAPAEIIAQPEPIHVIEIAPGTVATEVDSNGNQIINVFLNFIFGDSGALSSVEVPANVLPQIASAARV